MIDVDEARSRLRRIVRHVESKEYYAVGAAVGTWRPSADSPGEPAARRCSSLPARRPLHVSALSVLYPAHAGSLSWWSTARSACLRSQPGWHSGGACAGARARRRFDEPRGPARRRDGRPGRSGAHEHLDRLRRLPPDARGSGDPVADADRGSLAGHLPRRLGPRFSHSPRLPRCRRSTGAISS